jgi:hypothetical protein
MLKTLNSPSNPYLSPMAIPRCPAKKNSPVTFLIYVHWNTMFLGETSIFAWLDQIKSSKINLNPRVSQSLMIKSNPTFHYHHV